MSKKKRHDDNVTGVEETHHDGNFGLYMRNKIRKLDNQFHDDSNAHQLDSSIFLGCVFYVNGVTSIPAIDIKKYILQNGGKYCGYLTKEVTHVVCDHFTDAQLKRELLLRKKMISNSKPIHIKSDWITSCIRENKRISELLFYPLSFSLDHMQRPQITDTICEPEYQVTERVFVEEEPTSCNDNAVQEDKQDIHEIVNSQFLNAHSNKHLNYSFLSIANPRLNKVLKPKTSEYHIPSLYHGWLLQQELFEQVNPPLLLR